MKIIFERLFIFIISFVLHHVFNVTYTAFHAKRKEIENRILVVVVCSSMFSILW